MRFRQENSGFPSQNCLDGAPGVYSARWAGPGKDFSVAMKKVADEITTRGGWGEPPKANFISVLCLAWPDGDTRIFEGKVFGHLVWPPRGGNGFGYDPMFVPEGAEQTFGEMEPAEKYAISHRTRAFAVFKASTLEHLQPVNVDERPARGRDIAALSAAAASLSTKLEAAAFVTHLKADLKANRPEWVNVTLEDYLDALELQLKDAPASEEPAWRQLAKALLAASVKNR
jgi:XTP/dITP diphosphohydrolase